MRFSLVRYAIVAYPVGIGASIVLLAAVGLGDVVSGLAGGLFGAACGVLAAVEKR